jgi:hypothetical protein
MDGLEENLARALSEYLALPEKSGGGARRPCAATAWRASAGELWRRAL